MFIGNKTKISPISIVNTLSEGVWREFVAATPGGNIFQTPEMLTVFRQAKGYEPKLWAAVGSEGQVLALLPTVQVSLLGGPLRRLTTRAIAYGSCLCAPGPEAQAALEKLLEQYERDAGHQALYTELRNLDDQSALQPTLERCGFIYEDHLDYLINLDCSTVELMQNIGARTRKHIRQALQRQNVTIEVLAEQQKLDEWFDIVRRTYLAARVPLADRSLFDAAFEVLQPRGMVRFWLARVEGQAVAASVELLYKDQIYGWYGGVDRRYSKFSPGETLMWHILEWGALNGYKTYDFGGAGKPGEEYGVRDFKAKFGGALVCYGRNRKVHAPGLLRWSEKGYGIYRQLAGRF